MADSSNAKRFFQLSPMLLFEYEFNEKYSVSRTDEYGYFPISDFSPFLFPMKDGSYVFGNQTDSNDTITTNNIVNTLSLTYDNKDSFWFHYDKDYLVKGADDSDIPTLSDYIYVGNKINCITEDRPVYIFDNSNLTTKSYEEFTKLFDACVAEVESSLGKTLDEGDFDIFETLRVSGYLKSVLCAMLKEYRDDDYVFKYIDDDEKEVDLTYGELADNLLTNLNYYFDPTLPQYNEDTDNRVRIAIACELWALKNEQQYVNFFTNDTDYKGETINYRLTNVQKKIGEFYYEETTGSEILPATGKIPYDTFRIYFVGGYFLDGLYGIHNRVSVTRWDGSKLVLSDLVFDKETYINYKYLDVPMYVGGKIYDKCIEVKIPSVKYLSSANGTETELGKLLDVADSTAIRVEFSAINTDAVYDYDKLSEYGSDILTKIQGNPDINDELDPIIYQTTSVASTLLPQNANSDRLSAYIAIPDGKNYIEFCGMFDNEPLTWDIVSQFNTKFKMYNLDAKVTSDTYEYNKDNFTASQDWVGYHEIVAKFYGPGGSEIDGQEVTPLYIERYNFTQMFNASENSTSVSNKMKYRPIIDRKDGIYGISFDYTFRLINVSDDVQFLKQGATYIGGESQEIADFLNDTVTLVLDSSIEIPTVYNKIEQVSNTISTNGTSGVKVKYTRVFYNTSDIVLDVDGNYYGQDTFKLSVGNAPKNYKFKFRKYKDSDTLVIMDLTDAVYKLYSRDKDGNDIVIEPTYSSNMNLAMGEVEYNLPINTILKLKEVDSSNRFMAIVAVNQDNTQSSMFEFTYE